MCVRSHIHISCDSFCFQIQSIIFLVGVVSFFLLFNFSDGVVVGAAAFAWHFPCSLFSMLFSHPASFILLFFSLLFFFLFILCILHWVFHSLCWRVHFSAHTHTHTHMLTYTHTLVLSNSRSPSIRHGLPFFLIQSVRPSIFSFLLNCWCVAVAAACWYYCTAYNIFFIVLTFFELHWIGITGMDVHAYDCDEILWAHI